MERPDTTSKPSRRRFLSVTLGVLGAGGLALWHLVADHAVGARAARILRLPRPARDGVTFHGPVVLVRQGASVTALSARCPHLGCEIHRLEGEALVCPCHGSRFGLDGRFVSGPAGRDLTSLAVTRGSGKDTLTVTVGP